MPELKDGLDVVIEAGRIAEQARPNRVSLLISHARREARLVIFETQVVNICFEPECRHEDRRGAVDTPEELIRELVVEFILLFAGGLRDEGVDLSAGDGVNELKSIELEG